MLSGVRAELSKRDFKGSDSVWGSFCGVQENKELVTKGPQHIKFSVLTIRLRLCKPLLTENFPFHNVSGFNHMHVRL